jgi:hypothetical protein
MFTEITIYNMTAARLSEFMLNQHCWKLEYAHCTYFLLDHKQACYESSRCNNKQEIIVCINKEETVTQLPCFIDV